jgi:glutamate mutase epsilon subunit
MSNLNEVKDCFEVGDFVKFKTFEGEILKIHPKYATVIVEGTEHRVWINELSLSDNCPKRNQLYKESLIYKGYKTVNFNRTLSEAFKELSANNDDEYAMLECLKVFDFILGVTDEMIIENFKTVRIQTERLKRYSKKTGASYLTDSVASLVEEELLKFAILEDLKFSTTDRSMVAKVIAMVAGININSGDPTNIINQSVMKLKSSQLTSAGWKMVGRLMNIATKAGIRWNKDTFPKSIQTQMELS